VTSNVRYTGLFFSDTVDVTETLSFTLGGRYNEAKVDLHDETGRSPNLNVAHTYGRFNPAATLAWRASDAFTLFGGYSETNRAPTPLELGCSDPIKPCLLENSLVSDPPLKQVKSKTWEGGFRYRRAVGGAQVTASGSVFNTRNDDDIVALASTLVGRGYYANVPQTNRQGFDAQIEYETDLWSVFAGYAYVAAEYRFNGTIASPNNPGADANGDIAIESGDRIGGIPASRAKFGATLRPLAALSLTADAQYVGPQYFVGDEGNDNEKLGSYWVANLRGDYEVTPKVTVFARVSNLFDEDYASYATYFEGDGVAKVAPNPLPVDPEEAMVTPGAPRTFYVGLKARF
jgi:iron complex outermembrane receptor protein